MIKQRILFISNLYPNPCEPNRATFNAQQVFYLKDLFHVDVIAPIAWTTRLLKNRIPYHRHDNGISIFHPTYIYTPRCFRSAYGEFYYHSISNTAKKLIEQNHYDLLYAAWLYPDGWAAARLATKYGLPLYVKVLGTDVNRLKGGGVALVESAAEVVAKAKGIVSISESLKDSLVELGHDAGKISVVLNGVDKSIFHSVPRNEARQKLGINPDDKLVLFVGNLLKEKGLGELVEAFHSIAKEELGWRLVIIGKGPFEPQIRALVDEYALGDSVVLMGGRSLTDVALWMNAASLLCLPSYSEGMPNVVMEAVSCGANVVASSVGGIPEIVAGPGQIELVPPRKVEPLAYALKKCVNKNRILGDCNGFPSWQENVLQMKGIFLSGGS